MICHTPLFLGQNNEQLTTTILLLIDESNIINIRDSNNNTTTTKVLFLESPLAAYRLLDYSIRINRAVRWC